MGNTKKNTITPNDIEEDLQKLEHGLRRLRIQYEQYFGGGLTREPVLLRGSVNKLIKRYNDVPMKKYQHRFLFNSLVSRFNVYCEIWSKRLREHEEGPRRAVHGAGAPRDQLLATHRFQDKERDHRMLRQLHSEFLRARRRAGGKRNEISFEKFSRGVAGQVDRLKKSSGCKQVELRLVLDANRKVQLKARPGSQGKG